MTFYINTVTHEIHKETCSRRPSIDETYLGIFAYPSLAITNAKRLGYSNPDVCSYCCPQLHSE